MNAILVNFVVLVAATSPSGTALKVREVPFPYRTIQEAVDAAVDGDTIVVHPGTYVGTGNRDIDFGARPSLLEVKTPTKRALWQLRLLTVREVPKTRTARSFSRITKTPTAS